MKDIERGFGFVPYDPIGTDFVFGAITGATDNITLDSKDSWNNYITEKEVQFSNSFDTYCCVIYSGCKDIGAVINYQLINGMISDDNKAWLQDNGYLDSNGKFNASEWFVALKNNMQPGIGTTGKAFNDCVRHNGLIPESMLHFTSDVTQAQFYNQKMITQAMTDLGLEFVSRFNIQYELVYTSLANYANALKHSPMQVYVHAWTVPVNGVYPRTSEPINHAVDLFQTPPVTYKINDTYTEDARFGTDFVKDLAQDFQFYNFGFKYIINDVKKNNMSSANVAKVVKKLDSSEVGIYFPAISSPVLKQLALIYKVDIVLDAQGNVDWNKTPIEGQVTLYDEVVYPTGQTSWITSLLNIVKGIFNKK